LRTLLYAQVDANQEVIIVHILTAASLEERLVQLLDRLDIARAHFAGCMPRDWEGLAAKYPERISSLTLVAPMGINIAALNNSSFPILVIAGDLGRPAKDAQSAIANLPHAELVTLQNYFSPSWADTTANRGDQVCTAMRGFIARAQALRPASNISATPEGSGEIAAVSYRARGKGAPLVLLPLGLSPSQWEPLIPALSESFCTITLGGAMLGMVAHLEARAESGYLRIIRQLTTEASIVPGESLLEVGCGPGALMRRIARWTHGQNSLVAVDVNRYLLREAVALATRESVAANIEFREGNAENLPFEENRFDVALACTVMEEGNADRMLAELVRVAKRGGRVGTVVRSIDLPLWINLPLSPPLKSKVEDRALIGGNVQENGCADGSLYRRMRQAGLVEVKMLPQWASHTDGERLQYMHDRLAATLTPEELREWRNAVAAAQADGSYFIAEPFHCALGTKP
jgi:ubiquinone/menaquinone biosynthesis C-methylase UbiE